MLAVIAPYFALFNLTQLWSTRCCAPEIEIAILSPQLTPVGNVDMMPHKTCYIPLYNLLRDAYQYGKTESVCGRTYR